MTGKRRQRMAGDWRTDIAGLRAIAVGLVVAGHAGVAGLHGGYTGVDVFFVLSGFLITGILIRSVERTGRVGMVAFYARRARRILPAAMVVLLATIALSSALTDALQAHQVQVDAPWVALFGANIHFSTIGTDYFGAAGPPSPLQHYWSLAVEEQFYLVVPAVLALIALLRPRRLRLVIGVVLSAITVASLVWSIQATQDSPAGAYFSSFTRAWELSAGGVLAVAVPTLQRLAERRPRISTVLAQVLTVAGLGGIVTAAVLYSATTPFPGSAALLPIGSTVAVIAGGTLSLRTPVARVLDLAPFQGLGAISYSLYLWHWPVLVLAEQRAGHSLPAGQVAALVALSVGLAIVSWALIERPWQRARFLVRRPSVSLGAGFALLLGGWAVPTAMAADTSPAVVAPVVTTASATKAPSAVVADAVAKAALQTRLPALRVPLLKVSKDRPAAYSDDCHVRIKGDTSPMCAYGDKTSKRVVVLYGDSHAAQWLPALSAAASKAHWKLILMTKSGCPVVSIKTWNYTDRRSYPACDGFRSTSQAQIARLHPELVVVANYYQGIHGVDDEAKARQQWTDGLDKTLKALKPRADRVVYLRDTPAPKGQPLQCLSAHSTSIGQCANSLAAATRVSSGLDALVKATVARSSIGYVDTAPWLCTTRVCPTVINSTAVYVDTNHISATYSGFLSGVLGRAVGVG